MALEFRIGGTRIYPTVNTTITERIGTFSDATLPLELTSVKDLFLPMSKLEITDTSTSSKWVFVILADDVEVVKKTDPVLYRHNLTVRSGIYEATKHLMRNSIFSQPLKSVKAVCNQALAYPNAWYSGTPFFYPDTENGKDNYSHIDLKVNKRTKFLNASLKLNSILWEYPQGNTNFDNPTKYENKHRSLTVNIRRYDGSNYIGESAISFGSGQTVGLVDVTHYIFQNVNDNTVFKLQLSGDVFFTPTESVNAGAFAVVNVELYADIYYYSMYDICDALYEQSRKYYNSEYTNDFAFLKMTNIDKINELSQIVAPEITFNGVSYYDALYQLFSYIDAIPVVDDNGNLSFEYFNDNNSGTYIYINEKKADERISIKDENYTNKLVTIYQNARQDNAITYPGANKKCRANTKSLGIPNQNEYILKLPKPIDYVDEVVIATGTLTYKVNFYYADSGSHLDVTFKNLSVSELKIEDRVLESEVYNSLNDNREYYDETRLRCNCLSYSRGSDYIDLMANSALTVLTHEIYKYVIMAQLNFNMGQASDSTIAEYSGDKVVEVDDISGITDKQNIYYRVTYHGLYDGKVEQVSIKEKYEGETYVSQESAQTSLNRMGNNLQGLIAKVGNETDNVTLDVTSYGSRVKIGSIWVHDNERYIANVVQITFSTDINKVIVNAEFTKNFNLLSQFTKIDQQKRFYEISSQLTSKGYENITEYIYFSYDVPYNFYYSNSAIVSDDFLMTLIKDTLKQSNYGIKASYGVFHNWDSGKNLYLPMHAYGSGNSICFEMDYEDSLNAGNRLTGSGSADDPYYTKTTLYAQSNGFADGTDIYIYNDGSTADYSYDFPVINSNNDTKCVSIETYMYYKRPNEIFHLNYSLAFLSEGNYEFFFGDKFINNNAVIPNAILSRTVRFSYGYNKLYSIIDNKNINTHYDNGATFNITLETNNGRKYVKVEIVLTNSILARSWALVDENDNILIASNLAIEGSRKITFYVIPRRYRI